MTPEVFLIISLVDATIPHEPIRSWVTDPIAKGSVQPKACFVNEVIHVALDAAVVVAAKDHSLSASNKDPPREVNRAYSTEPAGAGDMARAVVDRLEHDASRQQSHETGLQTPHGAELIRDVVVLEAREVLRMFLICDGTNFGIGFLQAAKRKDVKRRSDEKQWR
jgi:hypothetical protein